MNSFGQRQGFSADPLRQRRRRARAPGSGSRHASSLLSRTKSGGRDKIEITRTALKQSRVTSRSSSRRGRVHVIKQEAEEFEDEDMEYDGCSSDVDVGNELEVLEPEGSGRGGRRGVNAVGKIPETVNLAMSSDDDEDFFMEPAGSSDEELIQEPDKVEQERTPKRGKAKEGGQLNGDAARGNPTAVAGAVAAARPSSSGQRERSEISWSTRRANGNSGPLPQEESPLPVGYLYLVCASLILENISRDYFFTRNGIDIERDCNQSRFAVSGSCFREHWRWRGLDA